MGEFLGKMHKPEKYGHLKEKKVLKKEKVDKDLLGKRKGRYLFVDEENDDLNLE